MIAGNARTVARTLLIEADGSHVAGGDVRWLTGRFRAYVDSRGFGGRLEQRDDVFEWTA